MANNRRRKERKPLDRQVWIDREDGSPVTACSLINMSETGAKLAFPAPKELPAQFILRMSRDGRVARKCRLAWATGNEVGVAFVARLVTSGAG